MSAPPLAWGTTHHPHAPWIPPGRVHIVHPHRTFAWCGVLVKEVRSARPAPRPGRPVICPECSINYLAATYPADQP